MKNYWLDKSPKLRGKIQEACESRSRFYNGYFLNDKYISTCKCRVCLKDEEDNEQ